MLENLSKNLGSKLSEIEKFYSQNKAKIEDIIAYGSSIRGSSARDIDLILLVKEEIQEEDQKKVELAYNLKKALEDEDRTFDVKSRSFSQLFNPNFLAGGSILLEGYSLISEQFLSDKLNLENYTLFNYNLSNLDKNEKTKFNYALKGRGDNPGVLESLSGSHFSRGVVLIPIENTEDFKEFLERWELDFKEYRIGMRRVI